LSDADIQKIRIWLRRHGVNDKEIDATINDGRLHLLVLDKILLPSRRKLTLTDVADRADLPFDLIRRLWRALGFPDVAPDDAAFSDVDLDALKKAETVMALGLVNRDSLVDMARVIGSSMARIAAAEVDTSPLLHSDLSSLELAQIYRRDAEKALTAITDLLGYTFRRHLQVAIWSSVLAARDDEAGQVVLAVGFADMVGFTALSQQLSGPALAEVLARFEELAYDIVARHGGRVVKMIGDEVMYSATDPAAGAEIALSLAAAYADDEMLSDVRVGLTYGPVVQREGDLFGPTVNLASRIVNIAVPGTVVVSEEVHDRLQDDPRYVWRQLRPRYLKGLGRVALWVMSEAGEEPSALEGGFRSRRRWLLPETLRQRVEERWEKLTGGE